MTATEELRRLLDKHGVEYKAWDGGTHPITAWYVDGQAFEFVEYRLINGAKQVSNNPWDNDGHCMLTITNRHCTPEQAIEATLGRDTCHIEPFEMERDTGYFDTMQCECGHVADVADWAAWRYCPSCGRRVVDD